MLKKDTWRGVDPYDKCFCLETKGGDEISARKNDYLADGNCLRSLCENIQLIIIVMVSNYTHLRTVIDDFAAANAHAQFSIFHSSPAWYVYNIEKSARCQ